MSLSVSVYHDFFKSNFARAADCCMYTTCVLLNPFSGDFTVTVSDINGLYFLFFSL